MTKKIEPEKKASIWDSATLFAKAQRYVESMLELERDDFRFALWSALALEMLARAALSIVHPSLLADPENWHNLYHSLGYEPKAKKFSPKSIPIAAVLNRLGEILPEFISELEDFCRVHIGKRNAELHSGDTPFEGVDSSSWLPMYYRCCKVLLAALKSDLKSFVGTDEAKLAEKLIASAADEAAKAAAGIVKAHQTVWASKDKAEKEKLVQQATIWATRQNGHRVECPACGSPALVTGEIISPPRQAVKGGLIESSQQYLPNKFECVACGMKIAGHSQLNAVGLGAVYVQTSTYAPSDFYEEEEVEEEEEEDSGRWEEDNNEPVR